MAFLPAAALLWAPLAWVEGRWQARVLLQAGADGRWQSVNPDSPCPPQAQALPAPVIPALVNTHSHAFQRAFVGLAERRETAHDDFWSWRQRMYGVALRITPAQLRAVAAHLYAELLAGGYTQVCEFHYLQHAPDGRPYADPAAMAEALAYAAADAGIGLTVLPTLYERAGFDAPALGRDQRRFALGAAQVLALQRQVSAWRRPGVNAGVAVHSLRAATPAGLRELAEAAGDVPIHVHAAEQTAEVQACLAATGCRPVEWLARHAPLDRRWQLVHATHTLPGEIEAVARAGAGVVLCPGTEANLGDGLCDLPGWLAAGVGLSLGSDSQVTRNWPEELRWLEYGQRLQLRRRNVVAAPGHQPATAARLFEAMRAGGAAACAETHWGLQAGARADLLLLNPLDPALRGLPDSHLLDGVVFASPQQPFARTLVAGRWATPDTTALAERAAQALAELTQGGETAASEGDTPRARQPD
jgi:formimidoylglutamate deiminase